MLKSPKVVKFPKLRRCRCNYLGKSVCVPFRCCKPVSRAPKPRFALRGSDLPRATLGAAGQFALPWA